MMPYTPLQLLFFFFTYCFIGWIIESTWVSLHKGHFVNRGFLRGPFIPIYGFGAMTLLLVGTPLLKWPVAVFFGGLLACSILEYVTGALMEAVFKVRYWDYSDKPFNINGHVCLFTSVCWGILAVVEDYFLHKPIEALSEYLTLKELTLIVAVVGVCFAVDVTLSFKAAFDLRAIIIRVEKAKEELRIMQKRLDVYLAFANAEREEFIEDTKDKIEDIFDSLEDRFTEIKERISDAPGEFSENAREEFDELREKFAALRSNRFGLSNFKGFYRRGIFLGNPTLVSKKFRETVESIKNFVIDKKDK